jgi:hypothetical protein
LHGKQHSVLLEELINAVDSCHSSGIGSGDWRYIPSLQDDGRGRSGAPPSPS